MIRCLRGDAGERLAGLAQAGSTPSWLASEGRVLKEDRHSLVALAELEGQQTYLKYYRPKGWLQRLRFRIGGGRAVSAYDSAVALDKAGVAVPSPIACVLTDDGVLLLTEGIEASQDIKSLWSQGQAPDRLDQLMGHAGAVLAGLHEAGYSHGDAKWSNFLVAGPAMYLIDLEAVRPGRPSGGAALRDIARFTLNAEDMGLAPEHFSAFIDAYAEDRSVPRMDIEVRMQPLMRKLRARHAARYGERGHALV